MTPRECFVVLLVGLLVAPVLAGSGSVQSPRLDELMQQKMEGSQGILEALVTSDYESVERLAGGLVRVSEVSVWSESRAPEYLRFAGNFRSAAETLAEEARAGDVDGMALRYVEMTLACVHCHRFLGTDPAAN